MMIPVGMVDDHTLFIKSLGLMIESFGQYEVVAEAVNGKDFLEKIASQIRVPEIALIDVNMPVMDGVETAKRLNEKYPAMRLIALSMNDEDKSVISMFKAGCCAYLLKNTHPTELEKALREIIQNGYYNADASNVNFRRLLLRAAEKPEIKMTVNEAQFLTYACSELTYKEIAAKMNLSERTIDGYRESLFEKFHVQSRVGLCLEAIRKGYFKP
jgi:DNA-binding NarL/FixJ family response regulator